MIPRTHKFEHLTVSSGREVALRGALSLGEMRVRLTLLVPEKRGELLEIAHAIAGLGGNIVALRTFQGEDMSNGLLTIKVTGASRQALVEAMETLGLRVLDARECLLAVAC